MARIETKAVNAPPTAPTAKASCAAPRPPTQISRVDRRTAEEAAAVLRMAALMKRL